jgi:hypothetical protein
VPFNFHFYYITPTPSSNEKKTYPVTPFLHYPPLVGELPVDPGKQLGARLLQTHQMTLQY